jgi:hypothetical protein
MKMLDRNAMVLVAAVMSLGFISALPAAEDAGSGSAPDIVTVRVKGQGYDQDSALKDALRRAVEKGGRLEIYNESQAENYQLIHDTILARVTGLIHDYQIVSQGEDAIGGYYAEIIARVDRKLIDATWGQVQILLQQMGRPKILVNFVERICDYAVGGGKEQIEMDSLLANKIEQLLAEDGFELVDKNQIEELKKKRLDQATIDQDVNTIRTLAGELGADMYIVGFARASGPQLTDAYGVQLYMWETDVTLKAFWSETAQVLFAKNEVGTRSGSRTPGAPGAKKAIEKAGEKLAVECLQGILEKWSRQTVTGGKVILEVNGVDFRQMSEIMEALKQIKEISEIRKEFHKPVAKFEIITTLSAESFAEILSQAQWPNFVLDILDQKFNTIQAGIQPVQRTAQPESAGPVKENTEQEKSAQAQPVTTQPAATQPAATEPAATSRPAASQPATTQPSTSPVTTTQASTH